MSIVALLLASTLVAQSAPLTEDRTRPINVTVDLRNSCGFGREVDFRKMDIKKRAIVEVKRLRSLGYTVKVSYVYSTPNDHGEFRQDNGQAGVTIMDASRC